MREYVMNNNDIKNFAQLLLMIGEYFKQEISENLTEIYYRGLENYELSEVEKAINKHLKNSVYFPKIADLVKLIDGSDDDKAYQAWLKVNDALDRYDYYDTVVFDDRLIMKIIEDLGGWMWLSDISNKNLPFVARDFQNYYRRLLQKEFVDCPNKLIGYFEINNKEDHRPHPIFIGDKEQAQLIYQGKKEQNKILNKLGIKPINLSFEQATN